MFLQEISYTYKSRKDLEVNSKAFECFIVDVQNKHYIRKISILQKLVWIDKAEVKEKLLFEENVTVQK